MIEPSARAARCRTAVAPWLAAALALVFALSCPPVAKAQTPAELISSYRHEHGEGKVTIDPLLNRIAQEQAKAMAAKDVLDHDVLRPFSARVVSLGPRKSAENIAYGYDNFPKTLNQWSESFGHRRNLLMHDASRVGIASARNEKNGKTYWAMVIAAPEPKRVASAKGKKTAEARPCRLMLNDLCLQ